MVGELAYGQLNLLAVRDFDGGCDPGKVECLRVARRLVRSAEESLGVVGGEAQEDLGAMKTQEDLARARREIVRDIGVLDRQGRERQAGRDFWQSLIDPSELLFESELSRHLRQRRDALPV